VTRKYSDPDSKKTHLTKKRIEALEATGRKYIVWDDSDGVRLGVRVGAAGRKVYILDYTTREGCRRRMTLAPCAAMPPAEARRVARDVLARVVHGGDPIEERREARKRGKTLAELWTEYEAEYLDHPHPATRKGHRPLSPRTRDGYRWLWVHYLKPALGSTPVDRIDRDEAKRLHARIGKKSPTAANRSLAVLGSMFTYAEHAGIVPPRSNPTHGLVRFEEKSRERFLSTDELRALGKALREVEGREPWQAVAAVRLLLLTGARRREVLEMRWQDLDLERGIWNLPDSKTGARIVPLNAPALAVLTGLPRIKGSPWVLPSDRRPGKHFVGIGHPWERIRSRAGLDGLRLHDLRHSMASVGRAAGLPLGILQGLLGHREARTTEKYAHIGPDPLKEGSELIGRRMAEALDVEEPGGGVVPIRSGGA